MSSRKWDMGLVPDGICINLNEYNPELNKELKAALPGPCRFDRDNKWWVFPLHWDTCTRTRMVSKNWDAKIRIAPALEAWALGEKARQDAIPDVQSMDLVDLGTVRQAYPALWAAISSRPFQTVGASFAARNRSCLIADQPGLGKTLQSIAAIIEAGITGPILVVAPKSAAKVVWPDELARWVPDDEVFILGSHLTPTDRKYVVDLVGELSEQSPDKRIWFITSPNYVRIKAEMDEYGKYKYQNGQKIIHPVGETQMGLFDITWSSIIVDESHQTLAGASGDKKKQSAQRLGLGAFEINDVGLRIALSGTPFRGKEEYLWGQLNWLRDDLYRSRWRWIKEFFDLQQGKYGMLIGNITDREAMYKDAANVMIRRTKAEVAADLPAKQYCDIWLDMAPKQAKAYEDIVSKAEAELEDGTLMTAGILSELTRLKQFAGSYGNMVDGEFRPTLPSNKFDWLVEFLDERGIAKNLENDAPKIIVASQFSKIIDLFAEELLKLGIMSHRITGSVTGEKREAVIRDWQISKRSSRRVLLMTTTAGGTGLTLDAFCDDLVTLDDTWDVSAMEQLEDRVHRLSRIHQVTIWNLRSRGTLEEGIANNNAKRDASIKEIIDGSRGIEFAKKIMRGDVF